MTSKCTEDLFLKDVAGHTMTVIRDDGVHRHLRFRKPRPAGSEYWFDLITWPGSLCIDGDMGTYVFRRLEDMFQFFRTDREYAMKRGRTLCINLGYWSEKLQAPKPRDAEEYSAEKFREHVKEEFEEWVKTSEPEAEYSTQAERDAFDNNKRALWNDIESEVLDMADDGDVRAYDAAQSFKTYVVPSFNFSESWEWNCREYTFHFVWCCYAIAWGIKTYDAARAEGKEGGAA